MRRTTTCGAGSTFTAFTAAAATAAATAAAAAAAAAASTARVLWAVTLEVARFTAKRTCTSGNEAGTHGGRRKHLF